MFRKVAIGAAALAGVAGLTVMYLDKKRQNNRVRPFVLAEGAKVLSGAREVQAALDAAIPAGCPVTMLSGHLELTEDHLRAAGVDVKLKAVAKDPNHHLVVSSAPGGDREFQLMAVASGVPSNRLHVLFKTNAPADEPQFACSGAHVIPHSLKFGPSDAVKREVSTDIIVVTWDNPAGWASGGTSGNDLAFWFLHSNDPRFTHYAEAAIAHAKNLTTALYQSYVKPFDRRKECEDRMLAFFRVGDSVAENTQHMKAYMEHLLTNAFCWRPRAESKDQGGEGKVETKYDEDEFSADWFFRNDKRFQGSRADAMKHALDMKADLEAFGKSIEGKEKRWTKESVGFPADFGSAVFKFIESGDIKGDRERFVQLVDHVTRHAVAFKDPLSASRLPAEFLVSVQDGLASIVQDWATNKMDADAVFVAVRRLHGR